MRSRRPRALEFAQSLAIGQLTRAWTLLFKGVEDIKDSPRPLASLEMTLIRLAYAADLPGPEDALRKLAESGGAPLRGAAPSGGGAPSGGARAQRRPAPRALVSAAPANAPRLSSFADLVGLVRAKRDVQMLHALEQQVRLQDLSPAESNLRWSRAPRPRLRRH